MKRGLNWFRIVNNVNKKKLITDSMMKTDIILKLGEQIYHLRDVDTKTVSNKFISNLTS